MHTFTFHENTSTIRTGHTSGCWSRASAAALSTVLRTTTLSYGNMRFSGAHSAENPQPIKMNFCKIDYFGDLTPCAKNGCNRLTWGGPTDRWNITSKTFLTKGLTLPYFTLPFLFLYASTAQTAEPICMHDSSNDATTRFAVRKCLLGVVLIRNYI